MKKMIFIVLAFSLLVSACLPVFPQSQDATSTPISQADLEITAAVLSQQTLQSIPTATVVPSETPIVFTPTETPIPETPTETPNPFLLTLTATLGTGTPSMDDSAAAGSTLEAAVIAGTLPFTGTPGTVVVSTLNPAQTPQPLFHGTLPPSLPSGTIVLFNKSQAEAYISLRCVTASGDVTILEYPVKKYVSASAPAGKYTYVAWVGGRQFTGNFSLSKDGELIINLFKDKITIQTKQ